MNPIIGESLDRVDGTLKATGGARYSAETPIPDLVHAVLIGSMIANGQIQAIDTQAAEAAPCVLAVLTRLTAN
ncbi:MAG: hypothetical protein KME45_31630 [Stenomitos rutilans HA7619-LM2]|jgi:xanthine dehydrogenase YagR molybdenum-binding subunit|nr:hypothetical protein [Stenomitos rutilans HA7619-LM2]